MQNEISYEINELDKVIDSGKPVRIIFTSGFQTTAVIEAYNYDVILCRVKDERWMVYKHNVSTIVLEQSRGAK